MMADKFMTLDLAMIDQTDKANHHAAYWMGYLGLLPFFATAAGIWWGWASLTGWLIAYGAVIFAFIGAIHWGLAMVATPSAPERFYASVVPALVAWVALLLPALIALPLLVTGFVAWRVWEHATPDTLMPRWFRRLRTVLTIGAVLSLSAGWIALLPFIGRV